MSKRLYAHFDIESDGPCVTTNNMIAIGIVFTDTNGHEIETFRRCIKPVPGKVADNNTMKEFRYRDPENKSTLYKIMSDSISAQEAMCDLAVLLLNFNKNGHIIHWIARPAAFDWSWLKNYYEMFKPAILKYDEMGFCIFVPPPD